MRNQVIFLVLATIVGLSACSDNSEKSAVLKDTATDTVKETVASIEEKAVTVKETVTEKVDAASEQVSEITEQAKSSVDEQVESVKTDAAKLVSTESVDKVTQTVDKTTTSLTTTATAAPEAKSSTTDHTLGKKIYNSSCQACHATGAAGAPKLGDKPNWAPRIATGIDKMSTNAINGFQGSQGFMPPKGGATQLSDEEVTAAVAYMVSESR